LRVTIKIKGGIERYNVEQETKRSSDFTFRCLHPLLIPGP
jgi:hypothetical protein